MLLARGDFGKRLGELRKQKGYTLRQFAQKLGNAPSYISDIENGNRKPPENEMLKTMIELLDLTETQQEDLYDLCAQERDNIPQDIKDYLSKTPQAVVALRKIKKLGNPLSWQDIIEKCSK